jgi:hypothetical protein
MIPLAPTAKHALVLGQATAVRSRVVGLACTVTLVPAVIATLPCGPANSQKMVPLQAIDVRVTGNSLVLQELPPLVVLLREGPVLGVSGW